MTEEIPPAEPTERVPLRHFPGVNAKRLEEVLIISDDLNDAIIKFDLAIRLREQGETNVAVVQSLIRDAIVQFMACFGAKKLDCDTIYSEADGSRQYFSWMDDLRDACIAHSFGPMRQAFTTAIVTSSGVKGVGHFTAILKGINDREIPNFARMAARALEYSRLEIKKLLAIVEEEIQNTPLEALNALPEAQAVVPRSDQLRMSRERFQAESRKNTRQQSAP